MILNNAFEWLKELQLENIPNIPSKAMWCGYRSHPDYSLKFPWILKQLVDQFQCRTYVEIGIAQAGGLEMMYDFLSEKNDFLIVGIDPLSGPPENKTVHNPIFNKKNIHLIREDSRKAISSLNSLLNDNKIDILIIDGDHSYDGAISDFNYYLPLVAQNGLIWFDDIAHEPGVNKAWYEIKSRNSDKYDWYDWGIGEIEGGSKVKGIDGAWIHKK